MHIIAQTVQVVDDEPAALDRAIRLGNELLLRAHPTPRPGDVLDADFVIPAARLATDPLTCTELARGLVVLSTLPNIQKHACAAQIIEIEEHAPARLPGSRIVHVSADAAHHWGEVDVFHGNVRAPGYSLCCADAASREAFGRAFGVTVLGQRRIAHGLFALLDGLFLAADVPFDQMAPPDVESFLERVHRLVALTPAGGGGTAPREAMS
jgi:hypothetical protein